MGSNGFNPSFPINHAYVEWACRLHKDTGGSDKVYLIVVHKGTSISGKSIVGYTGYWGKAAYRSSMQNKLYNTFDDTPANTSNVLNLATSLRDSKVKEGYHVEEEGYVRGKLSPSQKLISSQAKQTTYNNNTNIPVTAKPAFRVEPDEGAKLFRDYSAVDNESPQFWKAVSEHYYAEVEGIAHAVIALDLDIMQGSRFKKEVKITMLLPDSPPQVMNQHFVGYKDWTALNVTVPNISLPEIIEPLQGKPTMFRGLYSSRSDTLTLYDCNILRGMTLDKFEFKYRFNYVAQFVRALAISSKLSSMNVTLPQWKAGFTKSEAARIISLSKYVLAVDPNELVVLNASKGKNPILIFSR